MPVLPTAEEVKALLAEIKEEGSRMCDTAVKGEKTTNVLLIALTPKDVENLHALAEASRFKNYGVIVRQLIAHAAKAARA